MKSSDNTSICKAEVWDPADISSICKARGGEILQIVHQFAKSEDWTLTDNASIFKPRDWDVTNNASICKS